MHFFNQQSLRNLRNLLSLFFPRSFGFVSLVLLGLLGLAPCFLSAATIDDLNFTSINGDTEYSVSSKSRGITGALEVPATYNEKPVTAIGNDAFSSCTELTSVRLPESMTYIGVRAFRKCEKLVQINLPDSITQIDLYAFLDCDVLNNIIIPSGVTVIKDSVFYHCYSLRTVTLHDKITEIQASAFNQSGLTEITIPASVKHIGSRAFTLASDLKSIAFLGSAPSLGDEDPFSSTGHNVGGFTMTIYKTHEASYASWTTEYTVNVVPDPNAEPVVLLVTTHYNPTSKTLGIITSNEASFGTLSLQHTASLADAWTTLSTLAYIQATDSTSGAVTRSVTINPDTQSTGFYRLVSTD
jgi:hypothetical protein